MSFMWIFLDEQDFPDGCVEIEVLFEDGRIVECCSCDMHWRRYKKQRTTDSMEI